MPKGIYIRKPWTKKAREHMSIAQLKRHKMYTHPMKGKHHTRKAIEKQRASIMKFYETHDGPNKGRKCTAEAIKKQKESLQKYYEIHDGPNTGRHLSQETKEKIGQATVGFWKNEEYAKKVLSKLHTAPSKPEIFVNNKLQLWFPNEWKYIGDGSFWFTISGKHYNPDFINCNGKKLFIEFNGYYTHTLEEEIERTAIFSKIGFKTLFLHYTDLKDEIALKSKIDTFMMLA